VRSTGLVGPSYPSVAYYEHSYTFKGVIVMANHETVHGFCPRSGPHPVYTVWANMRQRCNNTNNPYYRNYGGRGIVICPEWSEAAGFIADMIQSWLDNEGPRKMLLKRKHRLTIERRDNNRGYSPDNCYWATYKQQSANQRAKRAKQ